jgi:hypothetical protein
MQLILKQVTRLYLLKLIALDLLLKLSLLLLLIALSCPQSTSLLPAATWMFMPLLLLLALL